MYTRKIFNLAFLVPGHQFQAMLPSLVRQPNKPNGLRLLEKDTAVLQA
jgi:hypothetical protein